MDRIELGTQSLEEYRGFSGDGQAVQATENTHVLITKLKSNDPANTLIVSSIQKMSNINEESNDEGVSLQSHDIALINAKRMVFIVDEAHRSTFGKMLPTIKQTFPAAIFFGFTGTPIQEENQKKKNTTSTVFGDELHRYSIADGIRDKNVLGFDPYKVMTFKDKDLRREVALLKAKAESEKEALGDPKKKVVFNRYMNKVNMAGHTERNGQYVRGIEDDVPKSQYKGNMQHQQKVVEDMVENWVHLSQNSQFHAIFATSSIPEAIAYYRLLKQAAPTLKISALFDPHLDEGSEPADYMNSRFEKYFKTVQQGAENTGDAEAIQKTVDALHKSFATLTQDEQKIANQFLKDVQSGEVIPEEGKTFRQYISEYQSEAKQAQVTKLVDALGKYDEADKASFKTMLNTMLNTNITQANIDEFGRFKQLKSHVDIGKAKVYFEALEGVRISPFQVNVKIDALLQNFLVR